MSWFMWSEWKPEPWIGFEEWREYWRICGWRGKAPVEDASE